MPTFFFSVNILDGRHFEIKICHYYYMATVKLTNSVKRMSHHGLLRGSVK